MLEPKGFKKTPKLLNTIVGLLLFFIITLCFLGAISFFINPLTANPIMEYIFGLIILGLSLWGYEKSIYLIFNINSEKETLLSPKTLYLGSLFFLLLAVYGFYSATNNFIYFQATSYVLFSFSLFLLAKKYSK